MVCLAALYSFCGLAPSFRQVVPDGTLNRAPLTGLYGVPGGTVTTCGLAPSFRQVVPDGTLNRAPLTGLDGVPGGTLLFLRAGAPVSVGRA